MAPLLALLFSLIAPGAGQIYNGAYGKGIVLGVLFMLGKSALLPLCIRLFKITSEKGTLKIFYFFNWFNIALISLAAFDSFYFAFYTVSGKFLYALIFAVASVSVFRSTNNEIIFTLLSGRGGIYKMSRAKKNSPTEKKKV